MIAGDQIDLYAGPGQSPNPVRQLFLERPTAITTRARGDMEIARRTVQPLPGRDDQIITHSVAKNPSET